MVLSLDLPPVPLRRLAAGEALARMGDPSLGLVLVVQGSLEMRRIDADGRALVLHRAGPGETLAEAALFEPTHHCDILAVTAARVALYPAGLLRRTAAADPDLPWRLAAHLAGRLVAARARAARLALPRAADRVLSLLRTLPADAAGLRQPGPGGWKARAPELGLTHEALYRALARLAAEGALCRVARGAIRLPEDGATRPASPR